MKLYTVDLSPHNLVKMKGVHVKKERTASQKQIAKVKHNHARDKLLVAIEKHGKVSQKIWYDDKDIKYMRKPYTKVFYDEWKKGFEAYQKGEWKLAQ